MDGPCWLTKTQSVMTLPLYVRPGTLLVTGEDSERPNLDYGDRPLLTLCALTGGDAASATLYWPDGTEDFTIEARRNGDTLHLTRSGGGRTHRFRVAGQDTVHEVSAASATVPFTR